MKVDVLMPVMGESITEGTVAKWLKQVGDQVARDEALLEITTDKIDSEIPAPSAGVLIEVLAEEGATVAVGAVLARVDSEATAGTEAAPPATADPETPAAASAPDVRLSPVARNIVEKEGIAPDELSQIDGSGSRGVITKGDVLEYLDSRQQPPVKPAAAPRSASSPAAPALSPSAASSLTADGPVEILEMSNMRKMIAERMVESKRISPHTYTVVEVDMTPIVRYREKVKSRFEQDKGFKLTYTHFILHAVVQALKAFPLVNASLEGDRIVRKHFINLGVAVALESGLIVPVIKRADEKNLLGIARAADDLASRAQNKKLLPEDVQGGTFTVTNPGVFGNIFGLPIINQPQLGILGVGAIQKRPVVIQDAIAIRSMMYLSLSYDHRVIDGALAARFTQEIRSQLETFDSEQTL